MSRGLLGLLVLLVTGCGQTGPLVHPGGEPPAKQQAEPQAEQPAEPQQADPEEDQRQPRR